MSTVNASMTVIGAGSYGTALAITLARNGHDVVLWGHDPKHIATLQRDRCNVAFLPDVPFPDTLHLESDLATALAASRNILIVVPSHVFGFFSGSSFFRSVAIKTLREATSFSEQRPQIC